MCTVIYYCHRLSTQLQLTNISYIILPGVSLCIHGEMFQVLFSGQKKGKVHLSNMSNQNCHHEWRLNYTSLQFW